MGGGGSQSIKSEMNFKSTTKILEENITENTNTVNASAIQANKMKLSIGVNPITGEEFGTGPALKGCKVVVSQTATADVQSEASLTSSSILESKQKIQDSMKANLSSAFLLLYSTKSGGTKIIAKNSFLSMLSSRKSTDQFYLA